jgi:diaminohydroxyphosphoribosylaminopyrimidine deaminase/5-amino-6-(5-phosphoribosylamino)uracil reductase
MELNSDNKFMIRALELATLARGYVSPNPLVGSVIVHNEKIIGEGWHQKFGEAHAEVNALNSVKEKNLLSESTLYVTLEPCSHFGKTPPCADRLVKEKVKRVVVCNLDSNPLVAGKGIEKLRAAGIDVITGVLEQEGRILNKRFFTFIEKQRPYIILKWAQTADGFIARENLDSKWISDDYSRQLVHRWRAEEDAILVGANTAFHDNPMLNVRDWSGRNPVRIVIDRNLRLPSTLNIFDKRQRTICYNILKDENQDNLLYVSIGAENMVKNIIEDLYNKKIQSIIIEGGSQTLQAFIDAKLWDEARVFVSPNNFGAGIAAPILNGSVNSEQKLRSDVLKVYHPHRGNMQ